MGRIGSMTDRKGEFFVGPKLVGPHAHPLDQPYPDP